MLVRFPFDFQWVSVAIVPMLAVASGDAVMRRHLFGASSRSKSRPNRRPMEDHDYYAG
jgi:hypothetical protein